MHLAFYFSIRRQWGWELRPTAEIADIARDRKSETLPLINTDDTDQNSKTYANLG